MEEEEYFCPSFSSYSSNRVAEIAGKISNEINGDGDGADGEEDFEFSVGCENPDDFPFDRQIKPIFPVFNRDLLLNDVSYNGESSEKVNSSVQVSLQDLFSEEREPLSSSSSEVDELESVPQGTYCVWKPKLTEPITEPSPSTCKKSNSTGSVFKRWSIRDLMRRSNSDGKDSFVFLTPEKGMKKETSKAKDLSEASKVARKLKTKGGNSSGEKTAVYLRKQTAKEVDKNKRKSYLPYRQDLVGIFTNVNRLGRTFPPF